MFDCVETLSVGSRPHYDVSSQSSCVLRKTSSFFSAPEAFCYNTGLQ
ncbi:retinoic acid receptor gamma-A-like isoform X2, partial [Tachysurus ichikawai]